MAIITTPSLLILGTEADYVAQFRSEYEGKQITIPEGRRVIFFVKKDEDCYHAWRGKNGTTINPARAQRILWIKFILETVGVRVIKRNLKSNNIVFFSEPLNYYVICSELVRGDLKFVTQFMADKSYIKGLSDPTKYQDCVF